MEKTATNCIVHPANPQIVQNIPSANNYSMSASFRRGRAKKINYL